jgi:alkylation response protein AidB-like acyl-CoA dehydrogenase
MPEVGNRILESIQNYLPVIRQRAEEFESLRRIPDDIVEDLKSLGLFRTLVPRSYGGEQASLTEAMEILETIASADGSLAWVMMAAIETPEIMALLPKHIFDRLYANGPDVLAGGAFAGQGVARVVDGGYMVSGRWPFVSGCHIWDYIFVNCSVVDENNEVKSDFEGSMAMLFRRDQVEIEDTWYTMGAKGTGSHHIRIEQEIFVPKDHAFNIRFGKPCIPEIFPYPLIYWALHICSVILGIAEGAMQEVLEIVQTKQRRSMKATLGKTPVIQHRLGAAEITLRAMRQFLYSEAKRIMNEDVERLNYISTVATVYANHAWITQNCINVVSELFNICGASSIYTHSTLQRRLRDIYSFAQHASLNFNSITRYGALLLGEEIDMTF